MGANQGCCSGKQAKALDERTKRKIKQEMIKQGLDKHTVDLLEILPNGSKKGAYKLQLP